MPFIILGRQPKIVFKLIFNQARKINICRALEDWVDKFDLRFEQTFHLGNDNKILI